MLNHKLFLISSKISVPCCDNNRCWRYIPRIVLLDYAVRPRSSYNYSVSSFVLWKNLFLNPCSVKCPLFVLFNVTYVHILSRSVCDCHHIEASAPTTRVVSADNAWAFLKASPLSFTLHTFLFYICCELYVQEDTASLFAYDALLGSSKMLYYL